jgi:hypothetical protein
MSFWAAVVIIVAIGSVTAIYKERLKAYAGKSEELYREIVQRVERLEERVASLETIVLEKERTRPFSDL